MPDSNTDRLSDASIWPDPPARDAERPEIRLVCLECQLGYPTNYSVQGTANDLNVIVMAQRLVRSERQPVPHCRCGSTKFELCRIERDGAGRVVVVE